MAFRIYTKTGDKGETALFGGKRVPKDHLRVDAYGTVDELNSFLGWLRDSVPGHSQAGLLEAIQSRLFTAGAHLASDPEKHPPTPDLTVADITALEQAIDAMEEELPELRNFILPGGHPSVSVCHVCRTVCRRAERLVVALNHHEPVDPMVLQYFNRLSDFFFVLARHIGHQLGIEEISWKPRG